MKIIIEGKEVKISDLIRHATIKDWKIWFKIVKPENDLNKISLIIWDAWYGANLFSVVFDTCDGVGSCKLWDCQDVNHEFTDNVETFEVIENNAVEAIKIMTCNKKEYNLILNHSSVFIQG